MSDRNKRDLKIWQSKINEFVSREKFKYLPLLIRSTSFNNRTRFNVVMLYMYSKEKEKKMDECIRCNASLMVHTFCTDKIHTIELFRFKNHNFLELQVSIVPIKRMHMLCIENGLRFGSFVCDCRMQAFWYSLRILLFLYFF